MIEIRVSGTSANMGPGFDTLGVALNIYNYFYIKPSEEMIVKGFGETKNNLFIYAYTETFNKVDIQVENIEVLLKSDIPMSRGLGSSASLIVAGVLAANELLKDKLSVEEMIEIATEIEGHPDNIVPAFLGGITASTYTGGKVVYNKISTDLNLVFNCLIPDFSLSTKEARSVLPESILFKSAVSNISNVALLISSLYNNNINGLRSSFDDFIHEPYRKKLIKDYNEIIKLKNDEDVIGVYISGAGPTMMVISLKEILIKTDRRVEQLTIDNNEARVTKN